MMSARDVIAVLEQLEAVGVQTCIDGGWGVDALLRRQTRQHDDLDLVVRRADESRALAALAALGFSDAPGLPARLVLRDAEDRRVDPHLVLFGTATTGARNARIAPQRDRPLTLQRAACREPARERCVMQTFPIRNPEMRGKTARRIPVRAGVVPTTLSARKSPIAQESRTRRWTCHLPGATLATTLEKRGCRVNTDRLL